MTDQLKLTGPEVNAAKWPGRWWTVNGYIRENDLRPGRGRLEKLHAALLQWGIDNGLQPFRGEATGTLNAYPEHILQRTLR